MIIIPDVHGRYFWRKAVEGRENEKIIFLGDYLDPYQHEWTDELDLVRKDTIANFETIIEFKKAHENNVVLLLGNHDCGYAYSSDVCSCRSDRIHYNDIRNKFRENHKLFDLAHEEIIGDKHFVFSHSGILKDWLEYWGYPTDNSVNIVDYLNNLNQVTLDLDYPEDSSFCRALSQCDFWRGGWDDFGSIIWTDARNILQSKRTLYPSDAIHIVGHTQTIGEPIITDNYALIDCRKAFEIDDNGNIQAIS